MLKDYREWFVGDLGVSPNHLISSVQLFVLVFVVFVCICFGIWICILLYQFLVFVCNLNQTTKSDLSDIWVCLPLTTWNPLSSYFHSFSLCSQWPWWPCGLWFCGFWSIWCIMLIDHNSSLIKLFFHDRWSISTIFHGYDYLWALVMLCGTYGDHQIMVIMMIIMMILRRSSW